MCLCESCLKQEKEIWRIRLHSKTGSETQRKPELYQNMESVQSLAAHAHTPEQTESLCKISTCHESIQLWLKN